MVPETHGDTGLRWVSSLVGMTDDTFAPDKNGRGHIDDLSMELRVPGSVRYLQTLRTVIGRAGHLLGFSFDGIEDLALAVDEAAVLLLELHPHALLLLLESTDDGDLEMRLVTNQPSLAWPPPDLESDTRWQIVSALSDRLLPLSGATTGVQMTRAPR